MTSIKMPDWDYGETSNKKLLELFSKQEHKDFFCEYLINEIPVDDLVGYMLCYTPIEVLKQIADDIGAYDIEEN
jgi:hypothetical protein